MLGVKVEQVNAKLGNGDGKRHPSKLGDNTYVLRS